MNKENNFNLIDFGSYKIRFSTYDKDLNRNFSESEFVKIDDNYNSHFSTINKIVKIAEKKISNHINDIILFLDTSKILVINLSITKNFDKASNIKKIYNSLVLEIKQLINLYYSNYYITNIVPNKLIIDGKIYYELPKDLILKKNLKIDFNVLCFPKELIEKIKKKFIENNLNLKAIFCSSFIKTFNYLKKIDNKKIIFLDIGLERTTLIYYNQKKLGIIQSIPIGSLHISKDISKIFKISLSDAERLKKLFNETETEFSYSSARQKNIISVQEILNKNISINTLKEVILYRLQEIISLTFSKSNFENGKLNLSESDLYMIGEGSKLLNSNSFYLDNEYKFKSINFYPENDIEICASGMDYYLNNMQVQTSDNKKRGIFERFFNFFGK
tara:strand:- start:56 stop:1219 length:1164 start_codon:yes stop_codon:yes gene_type:complete